MNISGNVPVYITNYHLIQHSVLQEKKNKTTVFIQNKNLKYMQVMRTSLGLDWHLQDRLMISVEGFFKRTARMFLFLSVTNMLLQCRETVSQQVMEDSSDCTRHAYGVRTSVALADTGSGFNFVSSLLSSQ